MSESIQYIVRGNRGDGYRVQPVVVKIVGGTYSYVARPESGPVFERDTEGKGWKESRYSNSSEWTALIETARLFSTKQSAMDKVDAALETELAIDSLIAF